MSCGLGCSRGSDSALLWLWHRPVATATIQPLVWEPPCATGVALEMAKRRRKKDLVIIQIMSLCTFLCMYIFYVYMFTYLSGIYLGVELLSHRVHICSTSVKSGKQSSVFRILCLPQKLWNNSPHESCPSRSTPLCSSHQELESGKPLWHSGLRIQLQRLGFDLQPGAVG